MDVGRYVMRPAASVGRATAEILSLPSSVSCLFDDPQLFGGTPATPAATIRDDFNFRHKHVLRDMPKPPGSGQGVRSKMGPVQVGRR